MITTLRDAKARLSYIVNLVDQGEEVIITVNGKPKARLTSVNTDTKVDLADWKNGIKNLHKKHQLGERVNSANNIMDDLRGDRF